MSLGRKNGLMWRQQQQRRRRRRQRFCGIHSEAHPSSYLAPYKIYPTSHTTTAVTILGNKTCNLPFYYASTCTLCIDPLQARPTKCCVGGDQVWQNMLLLCVFLYHLAYNTYYLVLRYMGIEYTTQHILLYITLCAEHYLQHFRQCCCNILPLSNMHLILWSSSWMKHTIAVRRYVTGTYEVPWHLPFRRGECLYVCTTAVGRSAVRRQWWWIYE